MATKTTKTDLEKLTQEHADGFRDMALRLHGESRAQQARRAFVAWYGRIMNEIHMVEEELKNPDGALREAFGNEADAMHSTLDHVWLELSLAVPRFLPPEFGEPVHTPIIDRPKAAS